MPVHPRKNRSLVCAVLLGAGLISLLSHISYASDSPPVTVNAPPEPQNTPNYHLVGWFNAVVPGGGELLLGNYALAGAQFVGEVATFGVGSHLSKRSPLTIDGVPEALPQSTGRS